MATLQTKRARPKQSRNNGAALPWRPAALFIVQQGEGPVLGVFDRPEQARAYASHVTSANWSAPPCAVLAAAYSGADGGYVPGSDAAAYRPTLYGPVLADHGSHTAAD